jgi:hypothetical protein
MTLQYFQLLSLPLEVLGVFLAMIEVFTPCGAERITKRILQIEADSRGFLRGVFVIATLGIWHAKPLQRVLVLSGLAAMLAYFVWLGKSTPFLYLAVLWPSCLLLILLTYFIAFMLIKLVSRFFPTRILGILGVLIASLGLGIESMQFGQAISTLGSISGSEISNVDLSGVALVVFYSSAVLCIISLVWILLEQEQRNP